MDDEYRPLKIPCARCKEEFTKIYAYGREWVCWDDLQRIDFLYAGRMHEAEVELRQWKLDQKTKSRQSRF